MPGIYDDLLPDAHLRVSAEDSWDVARRLARNLGLFVGLSGGAAAAAALKVAKRLDQGVVTTLLPDDGSKYVSLGIFDEET